MTAQRNGELHRLMGEDRLARPRRAGNGRDPAPEWDAWYTEFTSTDRRRLGRFMVDAPAGIAPDVLATWLGTSVDDAMRQWRVAALAELGSLEHDYWADDVHAAESAELAAADATLVGPQELACAFGVTQACIHQWRHRGRLPEPQWIISGVPIWTWGAVADLVAERVAS